MNITILTGAGISKESGILTFRDCKDGLWENFKVEEVATTQAWKQNKEGVLDFYNARRKDLEDKEPNDGHKALVDLEKEHFVTIVTQNVDNLHEKAGSSNVIHLHGELTKARSSNNPSATIDIGHGEIKLGDKHEDGSQLRPHIVLFGDDVPNMAVAQKSMHECDIFVVVGTSLSVYPAAGLVAEAIGMGKKIFIIDPSTPSVSPGLVNMITFIEENATTGCKKLVENIISKL